MNKYYKHSKATLIGMLNDRDRVIANYKKSTSHTVYMGLCEKNADYYDEILELTRKVMKYEEMLKITKIKKPKYSKKP